MESQFKLYLLAVKTSNLSKAHKTCRALTVPVCMLSLSISSHFYVCLAAKNRKKSRTHYLRVQGHSRSLMLTPLKSVSLVLIMISSMSASIGKCLHTTQANSERNYHFLGGNLLWCLHAPPSLNQGG